MKRKNRLACRETRRDATCDNEEYTQAYLNTEAVKTALHISSEAYDWSVCSARVSKKNIAHECNMLTVSCELSLKVRLNLCNRLKRS